MSAEDQEQKVSRRSFLKKVGLGTIGLGALSVTPAVSQLKITKNGIFQDNDQVTGSNVVDTSVTATGGEQPAFDTDVDSTPIEVGTDQNAEYKVRVYPDGNYSFNYAFNYDYGLEWDNNNGKMMLNLTVNWDVDPTSGNDVNLKVEVEKV